jgi:hypothetical protein
LAQRLGARFGHPKVLRHRSVGPRSEGGCPPHRPDVDPALRGAVAQSAAATRGRDAGRASSRHPARVCDFAFARQHVHALRVRCVDGPGVPGGPLRALLRRHHCPRSKRGSGPSRAGHDRLAAGGLRVRAQWAQDPHRVLQGRGSARLLRAHVAGSGRGAVPALPPVRFPDPPSEPGVRIPTHRALHRTCGGRS